MDNDYSEPTFYRLDVETHELDVVDSAGNVIKQLRLPPGTTFEIPSYSGINPEEHRATISLEAFIPGQA